MDAKELLQWEIISQYEPLRDEQMAIHFARLSAILINANRGRNQRQIKATDLMLKWWQPQGQKITDPEDILRAFRVVAIGLEKGQQ